MRIDDDYPVVVSGIRATGRMHLGNYIGAMQNFPSLQESHRCFFFVADFHTLTSITDPEQLKQNLPEIVLDYLAAGLDPAKSVIFAQSSVPEIPELSLLLGMIVSIAELQRCPTFKEKALLQPKNVNLGLFGYPVLMAADILIQKANLVPVGEDQLPHIEMTKMIARRFNHRYGQVFPIPGAIIEKAVRVPGLNGTQKMGKSEGNTIDLRDSPETIEQKISMAVSDVKRVRKTDPGHPYECNIFALHEFVDDESLIPQLKTDCESSRIGCVECKKRLAESVINFLAPFQERQAKIAKNPNYVREVLHEGGHQARKSAIQTLDEVRTNMGLSRF